MPEWLASARIARSFSESSFARRRALHRMAVAGLTVALLLNIVGPAAVMASVPLAFDDTFTATKNHTLERIAGQGVLVNDDPSLQVVSLVTGPFHGDLTLAPDGGFSYAPGLDYMGEDTFVYRACADSECVDPYQATATITVASSAPVAVADPVTFEEGSSANSINALANDTDPNDDSLAINSNTDPLHGSVSVVGSGSTATFEYTPAADYFGEDSFTYTVIAAGEVSASATVSITVNNINDLPSFSAGDDITVAEDAADYSAAWAVGIDPGPGEGDDVISFDVTNDNETLFDVAPAIAADGTLTFSLAPNAHGVAIVSATIRDNVSVNGGGGTGNSAGFMITVTSVPDAPVCTDDTVTLNEDGPTSGNLTTVCSDGDGGTLSYAVATLGDPADGDLVLVGSAWTYTPGPDFNGTDSFTFIATDSQDTSDTNTINLTVSAVNDPPTFGLGENITIAEDAGAQTSDGFLTSPSAGPADEASQVLSIDVVNDDNQLFAAQPAIDLVTGDLTFTPAANAAGTAIVFVTLFDGGGGTDETTHTFTITISAVNDAPVAVADAYSATEDTALVVGGSLRLTANDTDTESSVVFSSSTAPTSGTLSTISADGSFTYTPAANFAGTATFTYSVTDGQYVSNFATVTITIGAVNDAPVGAADFYTVAEGASLSVVTGFGLLANDVDTEDHTLTSVLVTDAANGTLELAEDGLFDYTPDANFNGTDTFTYQPTDAASGNTVTVTITVTPVNSFPVAIDGTASTSEDVPVVIDLGLLASDVETADADLWYAAFVGVSHGELSRSGQNWTYTPTANYSGTDTFTFYATDRGDPDNCETVSETCIGSSSSQIKTITITIGAVNDAPVAVTDSYNATEDTTLTVLAGSGVLVNDTDTENSTLNAVIVADATHGTVTLNGTGAFSYVPTLNYNGTDSFTYKANDGTISGNTVTVSLTISAVNDAPVAVNDSETVVEDTSTPLSVLVNDSDVDLNPIKVLSVGPAEHGTASVPFGGLTLRYVPDANYFGADTFDYTITDSNGGTSTATVTVNVTAVNDTPTCFISETTVNVDEDGSLPLAFTCTDIEATAIVYGIGTAPTHGSITALSTSAGTFTYAPTLNFNGLDSFTITGSDGVNTSAPITVTVTVGAVNDAPVAVADLYTTAEDTTLTVATGLGVLVNDSDTELSSLTAVLVTDVTHGSLTLNPNGSFTYIPTANVNGADSFTYRANDGTVSGNTVAVTIDVVAINDEPTASDGTASTAEDTAVDINLADFSSDEETEAVDRIYTIVAGPTHGDLTGTANIRSYTPDPDYNGTDTFTFSVTDRGDPENCGEPVEAECAAALTSTTQTITITIGAANDAPVAVADAKSLAEDTSTEGNVLTNDTDVELATLTAIRVTDVSHGILLLNEDGGYTYQPTADYNGTDSFTYMANDGSADSNVVTVTFTITPVNDAPVVTGDSTSTDEDSAVDIGFGAASTDVETSDDNLTYTVVAGPAHGVLTGSGGGRTYTPDADFNGTDTFTFSVTDRGDTDNCGEPVVNVCTAALTSGTGTITITIGAVNDAPVAVADVYSVDEDATLQIDGGEGGTILDNDTDAEESALTVELVANVAHGFMILYPNGTFYYAPTADYAGTDSFTYTANDGLLDSNVATVTFIVDPINDAPVATADAYATDEDTTLSVASSSVLDNDDDVEGSTLTAVLVANVAHGVLVLDSDGTFTYVPTLNFNGTDSFTYKANDGTVDSNVVTVTITVAPDNDIPVAIDGTASTNEDTAVGIDLGASAADVETADADLFYGIGSYPTHGELTGTGANRTYTPDPDYFGTDTFTFHVTDRGDPDDCGEIVADVCYGTYSSETKTITITIVAVNDAPVALPDAYTTAEDTTLAVDDGESGTVLDNDSDVDTGSLTSVLVTDVSSGTLVLAADGTFTYAPDLNFNGTDSFTYKANDGTETETDDSNVVTVTITVTAVNDAVIAVADDLTVVEDTATNLDVLANDLDVDHDSLRVLFVGSATHGTAYIPAGGLTVRYIPFADYTGADTFDYTVTDDHGTTSWTTVTITVTAVNDAPVAVADAYTTSEGTTLVVDGEFAGGSVLDNDTDVESNGLTAVLVTDVSHGTLVLDEDGTFSYAPATDFSGTDSFTYRANDGTESDTANGNIVTVTITVTPVNDTPVAVADDYTTNEDVALTGNVLTNDTDADLDVLHAVLFDDVGHGVLTLNDDGTFSYVPGANFHGTDEFTYQVNDGTEIEGAYGNVVTVTITVTSANDAPVAVADSYTTSEDATLVAYVLDNDTDAENDTLHVLFVGIADHGTAFIPVGGTLIHYVPDADYNGPDAFDYTVTDGHGGTSTATVTVNVAAVNDIPTCSIDETAVSMDEDEILALLFGCTDVDAGTTITYGIGTSPSHGSITLLVVENGTFTYVPSPDYNGTDTFTIVGNDGEADSAPITITVTIHAVNDSPVAVADAYSTDEETTLNVSGDSGSVLDNDSDVEIDAAGEGDTDVVALTAHLVTDVARGVLTLASDGTFTYVPASNFNGTDSFTYQAYDGTETDNAYGNTVTVTITVVPINDAPVAIDGTASTDEDTAVGIDLGVSAADGETNDANLTYTIVEGPAHGILSGSGAEKTFTPTLDYNGTDTFTFSVSDRGDPDDCGEPVLDICTVALTSETMTITITIDAVNDAPVAVADAITTDEDTAVAIDDVLDNDTDVDHDYLYIVSATDGAHGSVTDAIAACAVGILSCGSDWTYTPDLNFNGTDTFTYTMSDQDGLESTATVTVTITAVNDAPVAVADSASTDEDTLVSGDVLTNDTDVELSTLTAVLVTDAAHGTLVLETDGSFTYTPTLDYNGADAFTYKANDGTVSGNTVTVSITVTAVNDAPIAVADSKSTAEDTLATGNVLTNDSDVDLNTLTAVLVTNVTHGTLVLNANGTYSYTPTLNYNGADAFTYKANDGTVSGNTVTVSITVTAVNDAPVAVADSKSTAEDTLATGNVLTNDTDVELSTLTAVLVANVTHGTLTLNANGSYTYTPTLNYNGSDAFTYKANDGTVSGNTVTVSITVTAVNDAPIAVADSKSTAEDTLATGNVLTNDSDVDLNTLTAVLVTNAAHGTLVLNANGTYSYTPTLNYNGADAFTYKANDGTVSGNTVTVSITVTAVNDAPVAVADTASLPEGSAAQLYNIISNDTDAEGNSLVLTAVSVASTRGTVAIVGNQLRYTPVHLFWGTASISYTISDQHGGSDTGLLTVTVVRDLTAPVVTMPVVTLGAGTIAGTIPLRVSWSATDIGGVGVVSYLVQVSRDGGAYTDFSAGGATSRTDFVLNNSDYVFRVRATDAAGNVSAFVTAGSRNAVMIQSGATNVTRLMSPWNYVTAGSGQSYHWSARIGASASFSFTGREVVWVAPKNSSSGTARVYIDGVIFTNVDLYSATDQAGQQVFKHIFAGSGGHTIKVVVAISGRRMNVDNFIVLR